ncbi:hypothetical protein [Prosthecobacter sp.]|uniref:hypothetical protein n=1 Tax=Prosthecobacter sp. TaxID=1965333 RepID=UPI0024895AB9|nr:hypothetical protein [Prosthecobacter sp.]MDI1312756.1 hypothetical protein [Prosthecobacter sp.]
MCPVAAADGGVAEFDKLQISYQGAVERETAPLRDKYLVELEKLRDTFSRAGNLVGVNLVQAEITTMNQQIAFAKTGKRTPTQATAVAAANAGKQAAGAEMPELRWFVGKTWLTAAMTKWKFEKDGTGDHVRGGQKVATFTWRLLPSGAVELSVRTAPDKPVTTMFLKFKNKLEAWFGPSEASLTERLHYE